MIKKKYKQRVLKDHANETYARLRRALRHGRISQQGYKLWKKKSLDCRLGTGLYVNTQDMGSKSYLLTTVYMCRPP